MDGYVLSRQDLAKLRTLLARPDGGPPRPATPNVQPVKRWYRIVTNEGDGEYTLRLQQVNATSRQLEDVGEGKPGTGVDVTAYDVQGAQTGAADQKVQGWKVFVHGEWLTLLDLSASAQTGTHATPAVMLPSTFETSAAQTDSWDRASPPEGYDGTQMRLQTRMSYDHSGDKKLYAYYRTFVYDSLGLLVSWSAETRVEVDAAGEGVCS